MARRRHHERHFAGSDAVRDVILGMSDGLTTPFALAAGLAGAAPNNLLVVIGGLAEIAAGSHEERAEVRRIFRGYGLRGPALDQATHAITAERDAWIRFMMREEPGLEEPAPRAALWSAARIAAAYALAGLIPLLGVGGAAAGVAFAIGRALALLGG